MNKELIKRLKKWKNGEKADPEKVQIYPTNQCNLNCIFCAQRRNDYGYKEEVSRKRWFELAEEIGKMNVNRVLISGGGEPFMKKETTLKMMKIFKNNDIKGRLITNGTLLDNKIIKEIIEMRWDNLIFSIDGPDSATHDNLRDSKGSFSKSIDSIQKLNNISKGNYPEVEINFVLTKKNYAKLPGMIFLCKKLEISSINFEPLTVNNKQDEDLKINKEQRRDLIENIIPKTEKLIEDIYPELITNLSRLKCNKIERAGQMKDEIKNITKNSSRNFEDSPCFEPWIWPKIEPNGDVWPCSTVPLTKNIKYKSFTDIWYGKEFNDFRKKISMGDLPEHCDNCVTSHVQINKEIREELRRS